MDILVKAEDKLFISVHGVIGARLAEIIDTLLHPDRIAARRIKIANIEITLFEEEG